MASALGQFCCSVFFRPGKRHSTLWSRLSPSGDWKSCCSEEKCFTERQVTCRASDAHVTENKDGVSPYVLSMQNAVFAFLWEIMLPFDMKDVRKCLHWWVSALLCCRSTNTLWYWNSLLSNTSSIQIQSIQILTLEMEHCRCSKGKWAGDISVSERKWQVISIDVKGSGQVILKWREVNRWCHYVHHAYIA